jgi:hypothetical protein
MSQPSHIRRAICLLLAIVLAVPISVGSARAALGAPTSGAMVASLHHGLPTSNGEHAQHPPCTKDCCPRAACDLSACIATGLLPQIANLPGAMPPVPFAFPWRSKAPPALLIDMPLRPPIA